MIQRLVRGQSSTKKENINTEATEVILIENCFDRNYKVIIGNDIGAEYVTALDWINKNTKGNVQVRIFKTNKVGDRWVVCSSGYDKCFFAFENFDDAIMFRIKYGGFVATG